MVKRRTSIVTVLACLAVGAASPVTASATAGHHHHPKPPKKRVFATSGHFKYKVPKGVHHVTVKLWGAGGSGGNFAPHTSSGPTDYVGGGGGGQGAFVEGRLKVKPGQKLKITVGVGGPITAVDGATGTESRVADLVAAPGQGGLEGQTAGTCSSGAGGAGGPAAVVTGHVTASHAGHAGGGGSCAPFIGQGGKGGGANDKTGKGKRGAGGDGQGGTRLLDGGYSGTVIVIPVT